MNEGKFILQHPSINEGKPIELKGFKIEEAPRTWPFGEEEMSFNDALKKLNIEDYGERIFHSNSHGELFHLYDYIVIAKWLDEKSLPLFREWFVDIVKQAEAKWKRPESVFQHMPRILSEMNG